MPTNYFSRKINRREFLETTTKSALALTGGISLEAVLKGCATAPIPEDGRETRNVRWESNQAIPVPEEGCYLAWYKEIIGERPVTTWHLERTSEEKILNPLKNFKEKYGHFPAVYSFTDKGIYEGYFPVKILDCIYGVGTIPLIRYYCSSSFDNVARGNHDKQLRQFAEAAREYGKPFFLTPYPEVNITSKYKYIHVWGGESGSEFRKAWRHMYHIFKEEGANDFVVWGLHLIGFGGSTAKRPFNAFKIDDNLVDWVGFTVYNLERESHYYGGSGLPTSFSSMINDGYYWATKNYPSKPIALWEFGSSNTRSQAKWIKDAYKRIEKLPRIKLTLYCEYSTWTPVRESTNIIDDASIVSFSHVVNNPYFIKSSR